MANLERSAGNATKSVVQQTVTLANYSGPLPPPEAFAAFDRTVPGAAERILQMAEVEQRHRHQQERDNTTVFARETLIGQIFAFLIAVVTVCIGAYTAVHGAQVAGSFIGTGGLVGIVTAFILGRRRQSSSSKS